MPGMWFVFPTGVGMNRTKTKGAIAEFKISLKKALNENDNATENLFVFIDELDRCRPTYAIELLERIKHLLDIDGLVFILAMDCSGQLIPDSDLSLSSFTTGGNPLLAVCGRCRL